MVFSSIGFLLYFYYISIGFLLGSRKPRPILGKGLRGEEKVVSRGCGGMEARVLLLLLWRRDGKVSSVGFAGIARSRNRRAVFFFGTAWPCWWALGSVSRLGSRAMLAGESVLNHVDRTLLMVDSRSVASREASCSL